jgi:ligand-binding sensor domain-containing protein/signal transduction histidine kinase
VSGRQRNAAGRHRVVSLSLLLLFVAILHPRSGCGEEPRQGSLNPAPLARADSLPRSIAVKEGRDIRFRRLPRSSGLSQTRVAAVTQDGVGFMWFATQYGLNRFDGYKSKVFKHELRRDDSLSCVYVRALLVDHRGRLWAGCDGYLNRYEPATEAFIHYPIDPASSGTLSQVLRIDEGRDGNLWISSTKGLYNFDPDSSRTIRYLHDPQDRNSLSSNLIYQAHEDRMGRFWVASAGGLDEFDTGKGKVIRHAPLRTSLGWFHQDRFGVFWMATEDLSCTLASWDLDTDQIKCHSIEYSVNHKLERINLGQIIEDVDGTLWLTSSDGLLKLGPDRSEVIRYHSNPSDVESLQSDKMIYIFQDREENIWTCFQVTEPNYFAHGLQNFENFTYQRGQLVDPLVTSIYEDHRGILWIGSMGGLNRIDRRTGKNVVPPGSGVRNEILSILEDRSQVIFAGTFHRGLERIDPDSGQMSPYVQGRHSNSAKYPITRLIFDHAGDLWVAEYGGIGHFNALTGNLITSAPDREDSMGYQAIAEDVDGTMWAGSQTGLHHFDPATQRFTLLQHKPDDASSLSDNRVNSIHIDRSGRVWVGTQNGLDKYDRKTGTFAAYTDLDGLSGNVVSCILEDSHGALWMSTNNGISRLDPNLNRFENYSPSDGLPGPDLTGWGACYQSPKGEMFFGGFSGATAFYPERIAHRNFVPNVVLTDFRLGGISLRPGQTSLLGKSITFSSFVEITPTQNDFSIEFSALSFFDPETNRYRYRLIGLDENWHEAASNQRLASYTTLPVARYTFEVEGATSHGRWSEPTRLTIQVLPAWYKTQTFRALCLFALIGLAWFTYALRIRSLERQFAVALEARVAERTRIARELHDTLLQSLHGLMFRSQAARNMLPRRTEEAMEALDGAITRTEQAIAESRDAIKDLRTAAPAQNDIAEALSAMGRELAASREADHGSPVFSVTVEGQPRPLASLIQDEACRIAHEVMTNAFRHAEAHRIEAEIRYDPHSLRLRFRDDGKGIDPEILKLGGRSGHWGLPGIRERARRIGAKLDFWSEAGAGTEIQVSVSGAIAYEKNGDTRFSLFSKGRRHGQRA